MQWRRVVAVVAAMLLTVVAASPAPGARRPGFFPRPLFGRPPGKAAYCFADMTGFEDARASLNCWTPNDGWGVQMPWNASRAYATYHNHPPLTGEDFGDLRGYAPPARMLRFGERWVYRCSNPGVQTTCHVGARV
jgi:hypothetical protein